jgi:DNA helicase INO80
MHDPWAKKLFLGFARTSEFNGPRQPAGLHPLIQEVHTDLPILEPMLQLPYRIFGSSPPMSNFDPAKMLTVSFHHFCCAMLYIVVYIYFFTGIYPSPF